MSSFQWHLMSREEPKEGEGKWLLLGPNGGLTIAKVYRMWAREPYFVTKHGNHWYKSKVKAWAEIPPLEVEDDAR